MNTNKNREQRLRRALNKLGYTLCKSRKSISLDNFGEYMIVYLEYNSVAAGSRLDYTLDDVEEWIKERCEE